MVKITYVPLRNNYRPNRALDVDYSPIRTVIVSQGDVSDFHHIQGVVGDLIAVRIQDVGVFLMKIPGRITYCFLTNTEVVW